MVLVAAALAVVVAVVMVVDRRSARRRWLYACIARVTGRMGVDGGWVSLLLLPPAAADLILGNVEKVFIRGEGV